MPDLNQPTPNNTVNPNIHPEPATHYPPPAPRNGPSLPESAAEYETERPNLFTKEVSDTSKEVAKGASERAKDFYQSASVKAGETLTTSKDYVRRNPVPAVLGAIALGAASGCLLMIVRRKPSFGQRYAVQPLSAVREAILSALEPVKQGAHDGYDAARSGAGKAMDRAQRFGSKHSSHSFSGRIGRIGNNLKFW